MFSKKLIFFSTLLSCATMALAMKTKGSEIVGRETKRQKLDDKRSLHDIYATGDINAFCKHVEDGADSNEIGTNGNAILLTTQLGDKFNENQKTIAYKVLKNHGANLSAQTYDTGLSLVHIAADEGNQKFLKRVLGDGVNPNLSDNNDRTPLFHTKNPTIVDILCDAGTDVASLDIKQRTALFEVATDDPDEIEIARKLVIHNPHIVIFKDDKVIPKPYVNETAFERADRKYGNPNPDLRNEETARNIIVDNVFSQVHPLYFHMNRPTGAKDPRTGVTNFGLRHIR